eukprot:234663-Alexandrium_andersonii.AAC.1
MQWMCEHVVPCDGSLEKPPLCAGGAPGRTAEGDRGRRSRMHVSAYPGRCGRNLGLMRCVLLPARGCASAS